MAVKVHMPKMGLTMTEGTVTKWYKSEGDTVKAGETLFEVETDKLTNEVPAEADGVLIKIVAPEGTVVPCIGTIAYIGKAGETIAGDADEQPATQAKPDEKQAEAPHATAAPAASSGGYVLASPAAKKLAKERGYALDIIPASGPEGAIVLKDVESYAPQAALSVGYASGTARKIAQELGIDISSVSANGRVMAKDVLLYAAEQEAVSPEADELVPLSGMRKIISARMRESWQTSPRVWYEMPVDTTAMQKLRNELKPHFADKGLKLTYNHIIMMAASRALQEFPEVNASLEGDVLRMHPHVNMGFAVSVPNGLLVPNVKRIDMLSLSGIAKETESLIEKARSNAISMEDLSGGTFTISNIGSYGTRSFSPIINQPELAILGVASITDTPVVRDGVVVVRPMMNLNLVADHRVLDGVVAASFLKRIVEFLEAPGLFLM